MQHTANLTLPSILSLYKLDFLLQDYLATGGMLAASTPAISLMLIYGSAITATHLAGRLQGGDFIDEKITSPDVMRPAAALAMSPILEHAPLRGTTTTGADNVLWRADVGQSVQRDVSSKQRVAEEASRQFTSGLASAAATSASRAGETFDGRAMGWSYEASGSQTDRALLQEAESLTHRYAESGLSSRQFAAALSAGIGASNKSDPGAVTKSIKGALRGGGTLTGTYATNEQLQDQIADDIARRVSSDRDFSARVAEGVKSDLQSGARNVFAERLSEEERSTLQRQASDTLSASRSLERSESMAERFGTLGSYRAVEIGHAVASDPALMDQHVRSTRPPGPHRGSPAPRQLLELRRRLCRPRAGQRRGRHGAAPGLRGRGSAAHAPGAADGARGGVRDSRRRLRRSAAGRHRTGAQRRSGGAGPGLWRAHVRRWTAADLRDPRSQTDGVRGEVLGHRRLTGERYDPSEVDRSHERYRGDTADFGGGARGDVREQKRDQYAEMLREQAMLPRPYPQIAADEIGGFLTKFAQSGALARAGLGGIVEKFGDDATEQTGDVGGSAEGGGQRLAGGARCTDRHAHGPGAGVRPDGRADGVLPCRQRVVPAGRSP